MFKKITKLLLLIALLIPLVTTADYSSITILPQGRGTNGDLAISSSRNEITNSANTSITALTGSSASTTVTSVTGFAANDYVLIHQTQSATGSTVGSWEINKIGEISGSDIIYQEPLENTYGATNAQVVKINEYHDVVIESGGTWTTDAWDESDGGILVAMLTGTLTVETGGNISVDSLGYAGGGASTSQGTQGAEEGGEGGASKANNGSGGGGGNNISSPNSCDGAGGGHSSAGGNAGVPAFCVETPTGGIIADDSLSLATTTYLGAAGGGGANAGGGATSGAKGAGWIFIISAEDIETTGGTISADGADASDGAGDGGGGAGGSIRLVTKHNLTLGTSKVYSAGGSGGGAGGTGRIATLSSATVTGTSAPTIDTSATTEIYNLDQDAIKINLGIGF